MLTLSRKQLSGRLNVHVWLVQLELLVRLIRPVSLHFQEQGDLHNNSINTHVPLAASHGTELRVLRVVVAIHNIIHTSSMVVLLCCIGV
jgi:hypothetical protein